jgi:hypothetical protein
MTWTVAAMDGRWVAELGVTAGPSYPGVIGAKRAHLEAWVDSDSARLLAKLADSMPTSIAAAQTCWAALPQFLEVYQAQDEQRAELRPWPEVW